MACITCAKLLEDLHNEGEEPLWRKYLLHIVVAIVIVAVFLLWKKKRS